MFVADGDPLFLVAQWIERVSPQENCQYYKSRRGAEEACWAHNPKVVGSKPTAANCPQWGGAPFNDFSQQFLFIKLSNFRGGFEYRLVATLAMHAEATLAKLRVVDNNPKKSVSQICPSGLRSQTQVLVALSCVGSNPTVCKHLM